jgi:hypothetical protein
MKTVNSFGIGVPGSGSAGGEVPGGEPAPVFWGNNRELLVALSKSFLLGKRGRAFLQKIIGFVDAVMAMHGVEYVTSMAGNIMVPLYPAMGAGEVVAGRFSVSEDANGIKTAVPVDRAAASGYEFGSQNLSNTSFIAGSTMGTHSIGPDGGIAAHDDGGNIKHHGKGLKALLPDAGGSDGDVVAGITGEAVPAKLGVSGFDHVAGRIPGGTGNEALQQYERIMKRYDDSVRAEKRVKTVWDIVVPK